MACEKDSLKQEVNTCLICGDIARGINFNVMTCMSCKAFFRRNALRDNKEFRCQWSNQCEIDKRTRSFCSACRLKKCFQLGMNANLIRSPISRTNSQSKLMSNESKTITRSSNDRLILTFDEWDILSNILQAYDEQNLLIKTFISSKEQSTLPPKIRWKISNIFDYLNRFYQLIQQFLEHIPQYTRLEIDFKRTLIRKNFNGLAAFNSIFLVSQFKLFNSEFCLIKCKEIYGYDFIDRIQNLIDRIDSNETLIKLLLVTLVFSSNCSLVEYDQTLDLIDYQSTSSIRIQDVFIVLLWKYLIYQYGLPEAVRRLNKLMKFYLDILERINEIHNQQHRNMTKKILEKILRDI